MLKHGYSFLYEKTSFVCISRFHFVFSDFVSKTFCLKNVVVVVVASTIEIRDEIWPL